MKYLKPILSFFCSFIIGVAILWSAFSLYQIGKAVDKIERRGIELQHYMNGLDDVKTRDV